MPRKGYNYNFKMFMEGIAVPFQSANIVCTPNGVEASINCHGNEQLLNLKPKTAIQIMYQDWFGPDKREWHLMCDAFLSRYDKQEDSSGGVGIAIQARDFRMDMRKSPAAVSYNIAQDIGSQQYYQTVGLFQHTVYKCDSATKKAASHTYDNSGLGDLAVMVKTIATLATGQKFASAPTFSPLISSTNSVAPVYGPFNEMQPPGGAFFLDAFVRGIWMEAAGGTKLGTFLNKRIRSDKRFFVPANYAGYNMWKVQNLEQLGAECATGDSQFTSIEAIIMRIAGMFMVRVFSCSTPNAICVSDNVNGKPNPAIGFVMDEDVRKFAVNKSSKEFGPPYILNSSMLLPNLDFTAPPDCNLIFPCMYHRLSWQHDYDAEITRGYYTLTDSFGTQTSELSHKFGYQVPTGIFNMPPLKKDLTQQERDSSEYKTVGLTLEERYMGVNISEGSVDHLTASREVDNILPVVVLEKAKADEMTALADDAKKTDETSFESLSSGISALKKRMKVVTNPGKLAEITARLKKLTAADSQIKSDKKTSETAQIEKVLKHHALLKYLNAKYIGRVITVEMAFDPYLMCGFPAIVLTDGSYGFRTMKTMIGMVQQIKHFISRDGEASTSAVLNNVRFIEESTDVDGHGNPLHCKPTDRMRAEVNPETLEYVVEENKGLYTVGNAMPKVEYDPVDDSAMDLVLTNGNKDYLYAKDLLSISDDDIKAGKANGLYLDDIYSPNKISRFYKAAFGQKNNFMSGTYQDTDGSTKYFMYDSIHEAADQFITDPAKNKLMSDYEQALTYIKRNVCNEETFFCGVLGLSISEDAGQTFIYKTEKFDGTITRNEYFGISTQAHSEQIPASKKTIPKAGLMSSILESMPSTAFIQERKDAVNAYLNSLKSQVEAVRFVE